MYPVQRIGWRLPSESVQKRAGTPVTRINDKLALVSLRWHPTHSAHLEPGTSRDFKNLLSDGHARICAISPVESGDAGFVFGEARIPRRKPISST